jgi:microcystin-dependent protein
MSDAFIGQIVGFGGNFAPRNWALCQGQIMSIAQNTALFSILGTTYGGNGQTTFALPDLRGRAPVSQGQGPGLSNYVLGEQTGSENVTLLSTQMPQHNHQLIAANTGATTPAPSGNFLAQANNPADQSDINVYAPSGTPAAMNPQAIGFAGGSQPFSIIQPLLAINFIICIFGVFPSRN